jgi:hypothetical protein
MAFGLFLTKTFFNPLRKEQALNQQKEVEPSSPAETKASVRDQSEIERGEGSAQPYPTLRPAVPSVPKSGTRSSSPARVRTQQMYGTAWIDPDVKSGYNVLDIAPAGERGFLAKFTTWRDHTACRAELHLKFGHVSNGDFEWLNAQARPGGELRDHDIIDGNLEMVNCTQNTIKPGYKFSGTISIPDRTIDYRVLLESGEMVMFSGRMQRELN